VTRDELVSAAIEALDAADRAGLIEYHRDLDGSVIEGVPTSAVEVVVDTVLARLARVPDLTFHDVVIESVSLTAYFKD
jgi:hypothetical protein